MSDNPNPPVPEVEEKIDPNAPVPLVRDDADGATIIAAINTLYELLKDLGRRAGHAV